MTTNTASIAITTTTGLRIYPCSAVDPSSFLLRLDAGWRCASPQPVAGAVYPAAAAAAVAGAKTGKRSTTTSPRPRSPPPPPPPPLPPAFTSSLALRLTPRSSPLGSSLSQPAAGLLCPCFDALYYKGMLRLVWPNVVSHVEGATFFNFLLVGRVLQRFRIGSINKGCRQK